MVFFFAKIKLSKKEALWWDVKKYNKMSGLIVLVFIEL